MDKTKLFFNIHNLQSVINLNNYNVNTRIPNIFSTKKTENTKNKILLTENQDISNKLVIFLR